MYKRQSLYCESDAERRALLKNKPKHWLGYYEGSLWTNLESPREFIPAELTPDQVREINAITHIENELIDDACGQVLGGLEKRGWMANTDIFFTTDHGELHGDFEYFDETGSVFMAITYENGEEVSRRSEKRMRQNKSRET